MARLVIIGAGQAGAQAAASARAFGWEGDIALFGDEPYAPYQRPPLSKAYLAGDFDRARLSLQGDDFWSAKNVDLRLGEKVARIQRGEQRVDVQGGQAVDYARLILATGARPRRLTVPGADLRGVYLLRGIDDVDRIRQGFEAAKRVLIVGAGYIGLEVAAVAAKLGKSVAVVEAADRVMARVSSPDISAFFFSEHIRAGVDIRLGATVSQFIGGDGAVSGAVLKDGSMVDADIVIVGVGVEPNVELAAEAGLRISDGIWVDEHACTEDEAILAAGDVTNHPNELYGRRVRLESVHNAIEQAKTAAATACGRDQPYRQVPWFWSDQYDLKLQTAGLSGGFDEAVTRGRMSDRSFCVFYFREGRLIASDAVNRPAEHLFTRKLIDAGASPAPAALADEHTNLKSLLPA